MNEIVKHILDTNASYRSVGAGNAKNTDLFLDKEHFELFKDAGETITVRFSKENLQKAILFIASILPRKYDNSSEHVTIQFSTTFVFDQLALLDAFFTVDGSKVNSRTQEWILRKDVQKNNGEIDKRFYFNGLMVDVAYTGHDGVRKNGKFTVRNYLAGNYSDLHIKKSDDGIFDVWITNALTPIDDGYEEIYKQDKPLQQIFYGAPGTGKSWKIDDITQDKDVIRTTFHPDSDYSTFVGAYKPVMEDVDTHVIPVVENSNATISITSSGTFKENKIVYKFVKQAFLKAYIEAWKKYTKTSEPLPNNPTKVVTFTTNDGTFFINAVNEGGLRLSKESISTKEWIFYVWKRLWKTGAFQYEKTYRQNAFGQAVAKWIFEKVPQCTEDKFEDGWKILMKELKDGNSVAAKNKTQTYHLSKGKKQDEISVWIEDAGKSYNHLESCYNGRKKGRVTDQAIVEILKGYNREDFGEAWEALKEDVGNSKDSSTQNSSSESVESSIAEQYLIIEEINRGNCAQIFGDIFQLLDRNEEGFSEYPIEADTDLQKEIELAFEELESDINVEGKIKKYKSHNDKTLSENIQEGRVLLLPPNLYIWATMNTSDQSLFPMDSAFKRRWEWEYMPIKNAGKNWKIKLNDSYKLIDWWEFLDRINTVISDLTTSEDKQLGYFFCQPDEFVETNKEKRASDAKPDLISAKHFVNKVIFYLWNDVFKDYAFDAKCCKDSNSKEVLFADFYNKDEDSVNIETLKHFFETLTVDNKPSLVEKIAQPADASGEEELSKTDVSSVDEEPNSTDNVSEEADLFTSATTGE